MNLDSSTLAELRPETSFEPRWNAQRSSSRYQGSHLLNLKRVSRDVVNTRSYVAGDPVRMIDWKAYARTDQILVREVRDEAAVRVAIAVSTADSMHWPTQEVGAAAHREKIVTKFETAMRCALNIAFGHLKAGDYVQIWLCAKGISTPTHLWAPRSTGEIVSFFDSLIQAGFSQNAAMRAFLPYTAAPRRNEVLYLLSDMLNQESFSELAAKAQKSALLHVLSSLEVDTSWLNERWTYFDSESKGREYQLEDLTEGDAYIRSIKKWQSSLIEQTRGTSTALISITEQTRIVSLAAQLGQVGRVG
jgi:uncharacterized protein (DUF58 family)